MAKKVVSVDFGSKNMHVVEGSIKSGMVKVKKAYSHPTPANVIIDGRIEDTYALKDSVKTAFSDYKTRNKNVIISMHSNSIILRELILPHAKKEQLAGAVNYEMEQYVSVDGKNNLTEFRIVDQVIEDGVSKDRIKVATIPKDLVGNYYKFIKDIKSRPHALDFHANAIAKLFSMEMLINGEQYTPSSSIAVVDFGYKTCQINIISKGVLEFSRLLSYGSKDIDMIISNYYNLSPAEAETRKMEEVNLDRIDSNLEGLDSLYESLKPSLNQLIRELQKVVQYYSSRSSSNAVEVLYVYGRGSRIKGIESYLKKSLNLPKVVKIDNISSSSIEIEAENFEVDSYVNALGAMIRL